MRFGPIEQDRIVENLTEIVEKNQAEFWAKFTNKSLGQARTMAEMENEKISLYQSKKILLQKLTESTLTDAVNFAQWICETIKTISEMWSKKQPKSNNADIKRQCQKIIVNMIAAAMADTMKAEFVAPEKFVNYDQKQCIETLTKKINTEKAAEQVENCYEALKWIEAAVNEKLIFEHLLLNILASDIIPN